MGNYNIGPKIGIEGEREFRQQIKNINDAYKALDAETRSLTAAFEANGDEQGKLEATSKQLQKQIDLQKQKMDALQEAVDKASEKYGENSIEATRLRGALYDTQATVAGLENELKDTRDRLNQTGDAAGDFADQLEDAGDKAIDFGDILKANVASEVITEGLEKAGELVKDFVSGTIEAAADVKAANSQFSQSFGSLEDEARASLEGISDDTNIAVTRMQGSYTRIFAFAKTVGTESDAALDIASRAMVAAADSAAYYDRSIEDVTETIQSFLKGNYENDAALGISATEVSRNTMANQLYAKSFMELSEAQKVDTLLAMVEAGNAASGAIGQAARESDSWENVTGELSESIRQLQAQAGKPALQKLTPVIQKITDKANDLIDDVDWDEFGEKFEDVADVIIDNGPDIIKTVTSLAAGFVAFKATQKAKEIVTLATGFVSMAKAATTAGSAVAASGALAAVSPWGLAATAIAGTVALVTSLALESEETVSDLERSIERLKDTFADAEETYRETTSEINGATTAAGYYIDRLYELEAAGLENAAASREYELTVEALNELIPDLNLVIDEQTGLVNANKDALLADVEAWQQNATAKALQEKYTDVLEAQARAEADVIDAEARRNQLIRKREDAEKSLERLRTRGTAVYEKLQMLDADYYQNGQNYSVQKRASLSEEIALLEKEAVTLNEQYRDQEQYIADLRNQENQLTSDIAAATEVMNSYEGQIQTAKEAMDLFNQEVVEGADGQEQLDAKVQAVQGRVEDLAVAYGKAKDAARESLDTQIGLFDEVNTKSEHSAASIMENWESQQKAFSDYNKNLEKAVELGLDEKLVEELSDGSEQSMQILSALVNDSKTRIADINAEFAKLETAKNTVADTMAEIEASFDETLEDIVEQAHQSGVNALDGLILGLDPAKWEAHIKKLAQRWEVYDEEMDINSPSRVAMRSAEYTGEGAIVGLDNTIADYERKMREFAIVGQSAYLSERLARAESYPEMYAPPTYTTNTTTTRTTNLGGVTVQIYTQPGQDAYEIAEAVQEIIQTQIAREEASL